MREDGQAPEPEQIDKFLKAVAKKAHRISWHLYGEPTPIYHASKEQRFHQRAVKELQSRANDGN